MVAVALHGAAARPVSLRAAEGGGAVGVQMVGNGSWHEGNRLTGQGPWAFPAYQPK